MISLRSLCLFCLFFLLFRIHGNAGDLRITLTEPQRTTADKPVISVANVGWGWFDLTMSNTILPRITRWIITEGIDTVFDSYCSCPDFCPGDNYADQYDLLHKSILGCKAGTMYIASVMYSDGGKWSGVSDPISFTTAAMPEFTGEPFNIILWGHSFAKLGDVCTIKTSIRLGEEAGNYADNFGHMLQTELRRRTSRNIVVINNAEAGTRQSDWMNDHSAAYQTGGEYTDTKQYPLAIFFFGANDAANNYPVENYGQDMQHIVNFLTDHKAGVIVNSIHHTTSELMAGNTTQLAYLKQWNTVMTGYSGAKGVWKGLDLYTLFNSDTSRFLSPDLIHPDLSEGIIQVVRQLTPLVQSAMEAITPVREYSTKKQSPELESFPNPFSSQTTIRFLFPQSGHVTLTLCDLFGRTILTIADGQMEAGEHRILVDRGTLGQGTYFLRMSLLDRITLYPIIVL